jgi:hypothetical protein
MSDQKAGTADSSRPTQPIADAGGDASNVERIGNPYESLDELMVVVEALCRTWPSRPPTLLTGKLLL